jgi:hypothetical protein
MPSWLTSANPDLIGAAVGFVLTLLVFSYLIGDNALFRLAIHIFVGVAAGYAAVLVVYSVILPALRKPGDEIVRLGPPLILGLWLLVKTSPRLARLGNPVMAYLVGVGAAAAIGGAVLGTIFPQVEAATGVFKGGGSIWSTMVNGSIVLVGTLTTLAYFHFGARQTASGIAKREIAIEIVSRVGEIFIAIVLGAIFAGVYIAALSAFIERMHFIWNYVWDTIIPFFTK